MGRRVRAGFVVVVCAWLAACLGGVFSDPLCTSESPLADGDGCCPPGANGDTDKDCATVCIDGFLCCGDGLCGFGESCELCEKDCGKCSASLWKKVPGPTEQDLAAVYGSGAEDVWAAGRTGEILRYRNAAWSKEDSPTTYDLFGVWASDTSDVWVVGDLGTLVHWNGSHWSLIEEVRRFPGSGGDPVALAAVTGTSFNDVWVVPYGAVYLDNNFYPAAALHWNGSWTLYERPEYGSDERVFAVSRQDVWLTNSSGEVQRWNGVRWMEAPKPVSGYNDFQGLWGRSSDDLWIVGNDSSLDRALVVHWNGQRWNVEDDHTLKGFRPLAVWGMGDTIWVVGEWGAILRRDSAGWTVERPASYRQPQLQAIWGSGPNDIWAVGSKGEILHRTGG